MASDRLAAALANRYRIERELGAGGMATVYLAADLKHDRNVAIKVLKPELAAVLGAERFVQEIKTTAALSHPHILPLFDSGTADGFLFYVMPYIEGETIRDRLNRETQLGIEEAVKITSEVADALDYAHRHGVIHRDIKPENILLHDGRPMVMDFGIALALSAAAGGRMTETGLSLGTPHYMSPEQATADKDITARSDVYSLASVLYEMLAGNPPHTGSSAQQIIMKIIAERVQVVTELRKSVPQNVAAALSKALEKLPADRFDSASAFAAALMNPHFTTATTGVASATTVTPSGWIRNRYSQAAISVALLLGAVLAWRETDRDRSVEAPAAVIAFRLIDSVGSSFNFDVARDGSIGYSSAGALYVQRPGDTVASAVRGIAGSGGAPVFSPDRSDLVVATRTGGQSGMSTITRIPVTGGVATPLLTASFAGPLAWSEDGWIYALRAPAANLDSFAVVRVRQTGGDPQMVARGFVANVALLPGERALVACKLEISTRRPRLIAVDIASGDTSHVADDVCSPAWSPTGHLLASRSDGTIRAIPFDPVALRVTGESVLLLDDVATTPDGTANYRLTADGTLLYLRGKGSALTTREYALLTLDGRRRALPISAGGLGRAAFSPDGRMIAYSRDDGLWTWDLDLGTNRRLFAGLANDVVWSPDGKRVAYTGGTNFRVTVRRLDHDTAAAAIGGAEFESAKQWLADGSILASRSSTSASDIVLLHADSAGKSRTILSADWSEDMPRVSHNGQWLAYVSREPGWNQLTVRTWPGIERKVVLADSVAATTLRWSPDDRTLYYKKGLKLMAVSLAPGEALRAISHRVIADSVNVFDDLHPDGQQLLVRRDVSAPSQSVRSLVGITGWLSELRRKVAAAAGAR